MPTFVPERLDARGINLGSRIVASNTVAASPSGSSETTICTVTLPSDVQTFSKVILVGNANFTVGTNGVSVNLKIRQTDTSGTTISATGATTATAANLGSLSVIGTDASPAAGQVYVLTMTVASGSAASTVSAASLYAIVV